MSRDVSQYTFTSSIYALHHEIHTLHPQPLFTYCCLLRRLNGLNNSALARASSSSRPCPSQISMRALPPSPLPHMQHTCPRPPLLCRLQRTVLRKSLPVSSKVSKSMVLPSQTMPLSVTLMRLHVMRAMRECIVAISVKVRGKARMQHQHQRRRRIATSRQLMQCIKSQKHVNELLQAAVM